ncbi:MAG: cupin domain-containing protein [Saprospiraceae bacterium]|jgi:quercetin dioxygenase-like cupin family protein|nr:cupin domain-containing protein [Saprospiraceae bacterium]
MGFLTLENIKQQELIPGFTARLIHTENMTIGYFNIKAGSVLPEHYHVHEQVSNVLSGEFEMNIDGQSQLLTPGQVAVIPSGVPHSGRAVTDCVILDVFNPVREDYKLK